MILLDTNVLTRMTDSAHVHAAVSRREVHVLLGRRERLHIVPQNLYEFWAVATRQPGPPPAGQNGLGMTCGRASQCNPKSRPRKITPRTVTLPGMGVRNGGWSLVL